MNLAGSCDEKVAESVKIIENETKYTSNNSEKKTVETSEETRLLPKRKIAAEVCKKNLWKQTSQGACLEPERVAVRSERKDDKVEDTESVEFVDDNAEAVTE